MGGQVVLEAADLLGDSVVGIVAVDSFYTPIYDIPIDKKLKFLEFLSNDYSSALSATHDSMFPEEVDPQLKQSVYAMMTKPDKAIGVSALYECIMWHAHKTPADFPNYTRIFHNINAGSTGSKPVPDHVRLIPGAGHFVALVKPHEFNNILESIIIQSSLLN